VYPRFSPDGQTIAFSGNYDGAADLYTIPVTGGTPTRVTHHPEYDRMIEWSADGDHLLYGTEMTQGRERMGDELYRVSAEGGMPTELPVERISYGDVSSDGETLVFTQKSRLYTTFKRYRGGAAPDVWLFDLSEETATRVTDHPANDEMPMWAGDTVYFLSDRGPNQRLNIWAHNRETGEKRQVTTFADFDVYYPAIGPSDLVFQAGGELYRMDLATENVQAVDVRVVTDQRAVRPKTVAVGDEIQHMDLSPSGERALLQARGNVYTVPAEHGPIRQLTRTSGVAERYPSWAPDGSKIAYFSDATGAYNLTMTTPDGQGGPGRLTSFDVGFRYQPQWGPNSDNVVFVNHARQIRLAAASGALTTIDTLKQRSHEDLVGFDVSWSPNGRWITYSRGVDNGHDAVFLYDTEQDARYQVTSNFYNNSQPVFGSAGRYLFLTTDRHHRPVYGSVDNSFVYPNITKIAAVPLRDDVPAPFVPKNDTVATPAASGGGGAASDATEGEGEAATIAIDREGFEQRMVLLPMEAGNYPALAAAEGKVIYHRAPRTGSGNRRAPLMYLDLETRVEHTIVRHADAFELSADGSKLLVRSQGKHAILDVAPDQQMDTPLKTDEMTTRLDPRAEWKQMFRDVGRFYRDYFYDPNLHGVDWAQLRERYGALIDDAATRSDVNFILEELIGELSASHSYAYGGDTETSEERDAGLLGVNWTANEGAYQIEHIVEGAPWDVETRSPLHRPGVDVGEGDYVLAVNGTPMATDADPWAALAGHAGEPVTLTVNDEPTREGARTVLVETMRSDNRLRYLEWVNQKRKRVAEATDGDVGYIYVPNTGPSGQSELVRQFRAQMEKKALIIDERYNSGGAPGDRFVELLDRRRYAYLASRYGATQRWAPVSHTGPQAMLINGRSVSGGDSFPHLFRQADRGPLVGTRTTGGLIGPGTTHHLVDGGAVSVPPSRLYWPDGEWFAEGHGVEPDLRVENDPQSLARGQDRQLQRAIRAMQQALEDYTSPQPEQPPYENRTPSGAGN
jgi:tricorn protease